MPDAGGVIPGGSLGTEGMVSLALSESAGEMLGGIELPGLVDSSMGLF